MSEFIKKFFGKESGIQLLQRMVSILAVALPLFVLFVGVVNTSIDKKFEEKLRPINQFIAGQVIYEVDKQYYKITIDPDDVKPIDLEWVTCRYDMLEKVYKSKILDSKIDAIRDYYMNLKSSG